MMYPCTQSLRSGLLYTSHLADAVIRELGVPLVTGDIPGVAVILGAAPTAEEGVALVKSYQAQGILVTLVAVSYTHLDVYKRQVRMDNTGDDIQSDLQPG